MSRHSDIRGCVTVTFLHTATQIHAGMNRVLYIFFIRAPLICVLTDCICISKDTNVVHTVVVVLEYAVASGRGDDEEDDDDEGKGCGFVVISTVYVQYCTYEGRG